MIGLIIITLGKLIFYKYNKSLNLDFYLKSFNSILVLLIFGLK